MIETGIDIVEISRIRELIDTKEKLFINKIYTDKEIEYCENRKNNKYQSYAVRFAAKEAIFKAISGNIPPKVHYLWKNIEITNTESGKPQARLNFEVENLKELKISLSHTKEYAAAVSMVEFEEK